MNLSTLIPGTNESSTEGERIVIRSAQPTKPFPRQTATATNNDEDDVLNAKGPHPDGVDLRVIFRDCGYNFGR
jgi:hypothetical protein